MMVALACSSLAFCGDIHIGQTPLHAAADKGHKVVAELLLANQAEVNARDNDGYTPLHTAEDRAQADVAKLLRQHGGHE